MLNRFLPLAILVLLLTIPVSVLLLPAQTAQADCGGDVSTCKSCHEGEQQKPVNQVGVWHTQHAFGDFCANCHAGDTAAADKAMAHTGMRVVLADPKTSCEACHAQDYEAKAITYQQQEQDETKGAAAPGPQFPPPGSNNTLFIILNAITLLGLGGLFWAFERGPWASRKVTPPPIAGGAAPVVQPWNPLARKRWSPYWAGAGLGIVAVLTLWISEQPLGSSGAFLTLDSLMLKAAGTPLSESVYFKLIMPPKVTWQLMLVAGVVIGALISALWSRDFRLESVPDRWTQVFGKARWKRWLTMFAGGMILEFGASVAGGCTSGLAIAGTLQLAGAGFLFIGALFATGIITAKLLYGRNY